MGKKVMTPHAKQRLESRYGGVATASEIAQLVLQKKYHGHLRLTHSRSLCSVVTQLGPVYFVWSKRHRQVITVLSRAQAREQLLSNDRPWPPMRGARVKTYVVEQLEGPPFRAWGFRVSEIEPESLKEVYFFSVPVDVALSGDYILELAWDKNPAPGEVRDIMLSNSLERMFSEEGDQR